MRIGVPKEIKVHEYRVGLTPASVREVVAHGHEVLVETAAAERIGVSDDDYCKAGAKIGAVARTSTFTLNNATLPFVLALADKGIAAALRSDPHLLAGLNVHAGKVTHSAVAVALGINYTEPARAIGG